MGDEGKLIIVLNLPLSMAKATNRRKSKSYPIVGIGASAGGLEAVSELLTNLSPDTGMAYVYIQHLDPTHKSMLSDILQRTTKMKVLEARNLLKIQPNHVFIIPPNKDMAIIDGVLTLNPRQPKPSIHMSVDKFFASLADKQKEGSIGIVLSGNAHDGTFGLKAIKLAGGLTFAQDETAKFQSMPKSAIAEGVVDMVLSPKEIAKELERISRHPAVNGKEKEKPEDDIDDADKDLASIIQLLKKATGVDFSHYKMSTVKRRIIRRMLLYKRETLEEYYKYLKQHTNEIGVLYQDMLINVTSFFRDGDVMEYLKKTVIPKILKNRNPQDPLRIWIPACSTGEEAYSLAMIIMETLGDKANGTQIQIFATDLSDSAIAKARLGLYATHDLADISPKRLQRFFEKIDGSYRIVKSLRDLCVFATHNVFKDPPFSRIDLISCCNLLIYLDNALQKKVISIFHYALKSTGLLVLGKSETIGENTNLFLQVEKKFKVYSKKKAKDTNVVFNMHYRLPEPQNVPTAINNLKRGKKKTDSSSQGENIVDSILLREFVPASVVVNSNLEILQFRGSTSLFLEPSQGRASLNLLKMARPELVFELRNTLNKVIKSGERLKKSGLQIKIKQAVHYVSIEVMPLASDEEDKLFLIVFEEMTVPGTGMVKSSITRDKLIRELQDKLTVAREDMRSMLEAQEANLEELQSANEEIVSSNEELQSINEELETSKEEVESSNEELLTINSELQLRNEQLGEAYEYAEVMFETIQESALVLDREFRVKKANKSFYKTFEVSREETEDTLLFELGNGQWNILALRELLEKLTEHNMSFNRYEIKHDFPRIGEKIMILNGHRIIQDIHRRQLIVLSIIDITEHRRAEQIIAERESWFRNMFNIVPVMIWVAGTKRLFTFFNKTWLKFTGRNIEQELGNGWTEYVHKEDLGRVLEVYNDSFDRQVPFECEYRHRRYDDEYRWILLVGEPAFTHAGLFDGYIGFCTEIHDAKMMHEEMERVIKNRTSELNEAINDLKNTNSELKQYAYITSHDLQEPLRKIITFADRLLESKEKLTESEQSTIDKIISGAERMRKLIHDLLVFSKSSRSSKEFISTDLNLVIKDVCKDLELIIEEKKAVLHVDQLPIIKSIPLQMHQLFYNLLSNSLKFSRDDQSPVIHISHKELTQNELAKYTSLDKEKQYCEIVIKDNGIGFKQEFAEQIFTIFQRLNDNKYTGSGIGLALVRKVVSNHNGLVSAKSISGKGSEFYIILPCTQ